MFKQDGAHESPAKISIPILQDFTKIPNTLLDALCGIRIPGECRQVLDAIIRNTLGWSRSEVSISMNRLSEITGIKTPNVARCIRRLENMGIIISNKEKNICSHGINPDVSMWRKKQKKTDVVKIDIIKTDTVQNINLDNQPIIKTDNETIIKTDNALIKSKDSLKTKAKQSEKCLPAFFDNAEKAQATEQGKMQTFQSLFNIPLPSGSDPAAVAVMVARKQAGKLDGLKNPIGYLVSISGKVAPPAAGQVVQMSVEPSAGISPSVNEPPRLSHADMIRIDSMWDAMTDKTAYKERAMAKDQTGKKYPVPVELLARSIFNAEMMAAQGGQYGKGN